MIVYRKDLGILNPEAHDIFWEEVNKLHTGKHRKCFWSIPSVRSCLMEDSFLFQDAETCIERALLPQNVSFKVLREEFL